MSAPHQRLPAPRRAELSDAAVVSRSWGMALATLVSRITGFIRIVLLAAILGAALSSAFSVANQLPNLISALVLEETFTAIFIPVLARAERDDADRGAAFVRRLVTLAATMLLVVTLLSVTAAPLLVRLMLGRDPQVNEPLTVALAYLLLPQVVFYGLSSVFMAILNNRNVFGPPAWAPVINNVVAISTLVLYLAVPGELSVDPVRMGNAKLLVLGVGTTLGVVAQMAVLLTALARQHISLRPLWGIDARLKQFGAMAAAMVLYVLISQVGLVVTNQIAATAAASGPAIYSYTWLVLMLPFGLVGVTVLTVVMPRLSRNAAADDTPAVLGDLSLATRLTMITLIPAVALMTVGGPALGSALFAYGNFGDVDAGYLGAAISLSAFTLIPYALVLLQLRVFYARQQPWTPITIVVVITTVKIIASLIAPHVTDNPDLVAGYLGLANGLGFLAGAVVGYYLLRRTLRPSGGQLVDLTVVRTILVTVAASLLAGLVAYVADRLLGLAALTEHGGPGSLLRLAVLAVLMVPIVAVTMLRAEVPEARAAQAAIRRRFGGSQLPLPPPGRAVARDQPPHRPQVTYSERRNSFTPGGYRVEQPVRREPPAPIAGGGIRKGSEVADNHSDSSSATPAPEVSDRAQGQAADDFQPDVAAEVQIGTVAPSVAPTRPNSDFAGDPTREPIAFDAPHESALDSSASADDLQLVPGASIAGGRYRLLVLHGATPVLQFWQALDTALDRQVALTFVDPDRLLHADEVHEILSRTLRLSRIEMPGIARVLDVVHTRSGGLVVAEFIRGGSLREVADTAPSPVGAARAIQSLAAAAEAAHHAGVALSIDHPSRVRVSIEGDVALAFPATMPEAQPEDDIRGIGAALYALLVNRWPLPESGAPSGLAPAERDSTGNPREPRNIDPDIPFQISAAASHAVQSDGGIRSASTLLNLLEQATAVADRTDLLTPIDESEPPPDQRRGAPLDAAARERRRRGLMIGIGVGAVILVVALVVLVSVLKSMFGDVGSGFRKDQLGLNSPSAAESSESAEPTSASGPGSTVKPVRATVVPEGPDADNPGQADKAIDGNPATAWPTDTYHDPVPFPSFKKGVGLLLQLPKPTEVKTVTITVPSTGTKVELFTSTKMDNKSKLTSTPQSLRPGPNKIEVNATSSTSTLLVWISTLGTTNGESRTEISEITIQGTT
nr:murein biosynthesis integral membrane protein MurJ [Mycobacterium eburneum]